MSLKSGYIESDDKGIKHDKNNIRFLRIRINNEVYYKTKNFYSFFLFMYINNNVFTRINDK